VRCVNSSARTSVSLGMKRQERLSSIWITAKDAESVRPSAPRELFKWFWKAQLEERRCSRAHSMLFYIDKAKSATIIVIRQAAKSNISSPFMEAPSTFGS